MNQTKILYLFTRTPLHVGAGASVGAIDQPIIRERHTGFPVIPATTLKGVFADAWLCEEMPRNQDGERVRVKVTKSEDGIKFESSDAAWLFGSDDANHAWAGALQFSEARLLAFPIRSAKGSFAWITCPLILARAARDGVIPAIKSDGQPDADYLPIKEPADGEAIWDGHTLEIQSKIVLEEYTFSRATKAEGDLLPLPKELPKTLADLLAEDPVWQSISSRLVILSNGMMSYFAQNACEVAQHVRISDSTGTAEGGALFNQENVPSETMFYSVLNAFDERSKHQPIEQRRAALDALSEFQNKVTNGKTFQFGGDASTGLGYCTVKLASKQGD